MRLWYFIWSTSSSRRHTSVACSASMFTRASMLSRSMACVLSHMAPRSKRQLDRGFADQGRALWAMFTAMSPIRSRSLLIFKVAMINRRSTATGW